MEPRDPHPPPRPAASLLPTARACRVRVESGGIVGARGVVVVVEVVAFFVRETVGCAGASSTPVITITSQQNRLFESGEPYQLRYRAHTLALLDVVVVVVWRGVLLRAE
jgi:hypothetical protein